MLRDGPLKYVRPLVENELEELYDLTEDPEELRNLAVEPGFSTVLAAMRTAAIHELQRTGAGFVDAMPPVRAAH